MKGSVMAQRLSAPAATSYSDLMGEIRDSFKSFPATEAAIAT